MGFKVRNVETMFIAYSLDALAALVAHNFVPSCSTMISLVT